MHITFQHKQIPCITHGQINVASFPNCLYNISSIILVVGIAKPLDEADWQHSFGRGFQKNPKSAILSRHINPKSKHQEIDTLYNPSLESYLTSSNCPYKLNNIPIVAIARRISMQHLEAA